MRKLIIFTLHPPSFAKSKRVTKYLAEGQRKSDRSLVSDSNEKKRLGKREGMKETI
jgi:hypothetical protein